jgi:DNA-binding CsgD family transcriptional regulator
MSSRRDSARRAIADLRDLAEAPLTTSEVFRQVDLVLRGALEYDAVCWHTTDPATGLVSSVLTDDLKLEDFRTAVELEIWGDDVATFAEIRLSGRTADTISRATGGKVGRSPRFRQQIAPAGFGDELRAVFDARGGRWGCAAFMRAPDRGPYRADQLALASTATRHIAVALQRSQIRRSGRTLATAWPSIPAVVVLGRNNQVISADDRAEALFVEFADSSRTVFAAPTPFVVAAEQARGAAAGLPTAAQPLRARGGSGRWFVLYASLLEGQISGAVAVVISPAAPADLMPVVFSSFGLTDRESEVALHAARGHSTEQIAAILAMSPHTVQDHLKVIFTKSGVRSRREFVANLLTANPPEVWQ